MISFGSERHALAYPNCSNAVFQRHFLPARLRRGPAACAKASITELEFGFATALTFSYTSLLKVPSARSFVCPLRCQLNRAHGHNNGVGVTKMLTGK